MALPRQNIGQLRITPAQTHRVGIQQVGFEQHEIRESHMVTDTDKNS